MAVISNKNMHELLEEDRKRNSGNVPAASVLDGSGRLTVTGRFASEPAPFDRGRVPALKRLFRLKETESAFIMSDPLFMHISAGDAGAAGFVTVTAVNRLTGSSKTRSCVFPFTFGSMEMPSSPSHGDLMLRRGDVSLDFSRSPAARYIRCRFENFDDVRSLYINLESELPDTPPVLSGKNGVLPASPPDTAGGYNNTAGAYYSLRPGPGRSGGFLYSSYVPCMRTSGTVVIGADRFDFSGDRCFASYEWFRGVPARRTKRASLTVCGGTGDRRLGITVTPDGTMLHDGSHMSITEPIQLDSIRSDSVLSNYILSDRRAENEPDGGDTAPFKISSPDGRLDLDFTPLASEQECLSFAGLIRCRSRIIFGRADGACRTDDTGTVKFTDIYAAINLTDARW